MSSSKINENESEIEETLENISKLLLINFSNDILLKYDSISSKAGSSSGDNYMSVVKSVLIQGKDMNGKDKNISLFIKRQIPSLSRRQLYRCDEAFNNEINAYKYIVPMLDKYTKQLFLPKCYFAGKDDFGEIIILEDLKQLGFKMKNRLIGLDFQHCELVMKASSAFYFTVLWDPLQLAKLHAAGISSREINKEQFNENKKYINEIVYCQQAEEFYKNLLDSAIKNSLWSLHSSNTNGNLDEPIKSIELLRTNLYDKIKEFIINSKEIYNVFCHGDLWINNIMFKSNSVTNEPTDCKFFDLQAMRLTSPIFDILHLIYTSTKRDFRELYLKSVLKIYNNSLIENLELYLLPNKRNEFELVKEIFSYENILNQFYTHILYGFMISMWILPAITFDPNNIPNLNEISDEINEKAKELNVTQNLTKEYHSEIKEIALEFYQNGHLHL